MIDGNFEGFMIQHKWNRQKKNGWSNTNVSLMLCKTPEYPHALPRFQEKHRVVYDAFKSTCLGFQVGYEYISTDETKTCNMMIRCSKENPQHQFRVVKIVLSQETTPVLTAA